MLWDVCAFSSLDPAKCVDVVRVYKIRSRFMDGAQVHPYLVRSCATTSVYLLQQSNILINQHLDKQVVKLPILHAGWSGHRIRDRNTALNIALGVCNYKEQVYRL